MGENLRPDTVKWAFFDFDGTLADTEIFAIELDVPVYKSFGIEPSFEEMCTIAGTTGIESIPALFSKYGLTVSCWDFFERRCNNDVIYYEKPLQLFEGAREVIEGLRAQGTKLAVVSTTQRHCVEKALERLDLARYFEFLVCGDEAGGRKPEPDPYLLALSRAQIDAEEAMVFEDSPTGVKAAQDAGIYTVAFTGSSIVQDTSAADEQFADYREFCL